MDEHQLKSIEKASRTLPYVLSDCICYTELYVYSLACFVLVVCSMRCLRGAFTDPSKYFIALTFTLLIFKYDLREKYSEPLLVNFFVMLLVTNKVHELLLKVGCVSDTC